MARITRRGLLLGAWPITGLGVVAFTRGSGALTADSDSKPASSEVASGRGFREYAASDAGALALVDHLEGEGFNDRPDLSSVSEQFGASADGEWMPADVATGVLEHPDGRQATVTAIVGGSSTFSNREAEAHVWTIPRDETGEASLDVLFINGDGHLEVR